MTVPVFDTKGKEHKGKSLPSQFNEFVRKDLIKQAVVASRYNKTQPHGSRRLAGRTSSAVFRGIRRGYGRSYNWGISRLPRLMIRGGRRIGRVMNVPQAKGGPRAHPPKAGKKWEKKMNRKERRKAIRAALAATQDLELVRERGHAAPDNYPFAISSEFEDLEKTKDVVKALHKLGLEDELSRASRKRIRAGRGKSRGRRYKRTKGPLIVVSEKCSLLKAAANIPGVDAVIVDHLNAELLAPGTHPGRLTLFTRKALKRLKDEKIFL